MHLKTVIIILKWLFYFWLHKVGKIYKILNIGSDDFHDTISELHLHMFMFVCCNPFGSNKASARLPVWVLLHVGVKSDVRAPRHRLIDI